MTFRAIVIPLVLVESEIEFCSMLDDRTIERRQQHMVLIVQLWHRNNQQTVIFTRIAVNEC